MRRSLAPLIAAGSGGFATSSALLLGAFIANLDGWPWGAIMPRVAGALIAAGLATVPIAVARRRMRLAERGGADGGGGLGAVRRARSRFLGAMLAGSLVGPPLGAITVVGLLLAVPPDPEVWIVPMLLAPALGMGVPGALFALAGLLPRLVRGPGQATSSDRGTSDDEPRASRAPWLRAVPRYAATTARVGASIGARTAPIAAGMALISTASTLRYDALLLAALPVSIAGAALVGVTRQVLIARHRGFPDGGLITAIATASSAITLALIAWASTRMAGADAPDIADVGPFRVVDGLPAVAEAFLVAGVGGAAVGLCVGTVAGAIAGAALGRAAPIRS